VVLRLRVEPDKMVSVDGTIVIMVKERVMEKSPGRHEGVKVTLKLRCLTGSEGEKDGRKERIAWVKSRDGCDSRTESVQCLRGDSAVKSNFLC
jgi:hypothetical protein